MNLDNLLASKGLDVLVVLNIESSNKPSTRFISGFTGSFSGTIYSKDRRIIITDSRYWEQVKMESDFELVKYKADKKFLDIIVDFLKKMEVKRVGIEKERTLANHLEYLTENLDVEFVDVSADLLKLRAVKSEKEVEQIRKAIYIAEEAFKKTLEIIRPKITEKEIAAYLEYQIKLLGGDKFSFDTIVASGWRGALPHGIATEKEIEIGEPVVVDWGAYYNGYASDLTRVFCIGEPNDEVKRVHEVVLKAQQEAINIARAGLTGAEIDKASRDYISQNGYGEFFGHSLGHGIGLEVHEEPRLSFSNKEKLPENAVVTVEPGIYLPKKFGIRIEDDIILTNSGCEVLSSLPRDIFVV
ncbi:Xaa-Pro dipeptidase [Thermosipho melanesiensis]|uniref:Peptidase M24 n=2 Tax=Thermosipho melanesiensis TaxID=46541 RepID=A6LJS0_THEM4|nr:aminopeptidase P family protein [Thermosipho melanesiensis]ABR30171.1 peptidase M24 [Thermosipho melanesiensis BI429]APT73370.1 Xaa-Pro dipeptidase [Thermosipho melanesiensis]OOC38185.1 Xaa-Pro dipeptidase [Thermosipho melanesiensis]OOC40106.1 Xaa-Pro dipeptidase [Thermosipho melanesiensis]OOC40181.1 Xaa-Pro dipeptidase [Thermosipho melanesiensis]